jgi:hypothetical protein
MLLARAFARAELDPGRSLQEAMVSAMEARSHLGPTASSAEEISEEWLGGRGPIPASASRRFTLSDVDVIANSVDDRWRVFLPSAFHSGVAAALQERPLYCRSVWWQSS